MNHGCVDILKHYLSQQRCIQLLYNVISDWVLILDCLWIVLVYYLVSIDHIRKKNFHIDNACLDSIQMAYNKLQVVSMSQGLAISFPRQTKKILGHS